MAASLLSSDEFSLNRINPAIINAAHSTSSENIDSDAMSKVVKLLNQN